MKVLPPTFTLQYHFNSESRFLPYIGAGINYTFFYDDNPGDAVGISYKDDFGFAFNIGFDDVINDNNYFNIDINIYILSTDKHDTRMWYHYAFELNPMLQKFKNPKYWCLSSPSKFKCLVSIIE